jgi:FixJ family two-component response regulator
MKPDQSIVHVIDDDEAVRDSISMLFETANIAHVAYSSATDF